MTAVTGEMTRTRTRRTVAPGTSSAWPYVLFAILAGTAVITLIPIVWMILTALKTSAEVNADPPTWIPQTLRWGNFRDAWNFAPFGRYLINSPMEPTLIRDADGGITLYVQHESPGKDTEPNWLPAPNGPFFMVLRLYWPQPDALDGRWKAPLLVERIATQ